MTETPATHQAPTAAVDTPAATGKARLDASRARIRLELMPKVHAAAPAGAGVVDKLLARVRSAPAASFVIGAATRWWRSNRHIARAAGEVSKAVIAPAARKHPVGMLGVAAGVGTLLVLARPWRLVARPRILFGIVSLVGTQLWRSRSARARAARAARF